MVSNNSLKFMGFVNMCNMWRFVVIFWIWHNLNVADKCGEQTCFRGMRVTVYAVISKYNKILTILSSN